MSGEGARAVKRSLPRWRVSPVWFVPLGAVLIGIWLAYRTFLSIGPDIVLELDNAEGLQAGKTPVKLHNVDVGLVRKVKLTGDYDRVLASIRMEPDTAPLLVEDTEFWVVKPRVGRRGISGLETIISGAYIQIRPGKSEKARRRFTVLAQPPATLAGVPGLSLVLVNEGSDALAIDDPVTYQGRTVGRVTSARFDFETRTTRYDVLVEPPYDKLVTRRTQFWSQSGIDVQLTAEGINVQLGTLQTLLTGGVTFSSPSGTDGGEPAENGDEFRLFSSPQAAEQARLDFGLEYLVLFDDSVRGLYPGAPVSFRGVRVGTVSRAPYFGSGLQAELSKDASVPVLIRFEPQRIGGLWAELPREAWQRRLSGELDNGLRASINLGSLLTGAAYISLEYIEEPRRVEAGELAGYPLLPSHAGGGTAGLEDKLAALLDKLNALPVTPVLEELESTLTSAGAALRDTQAAVQQFESFFSAEDTRKLPKELTDTLQDLRRTLSEYQRGQPAHESLLRNMAILEQVLENLESFTETISDDPNSLIFGKERRRKRQEERQQDRAPKPHDGN